MPKLRKGFWFYLPVALLAWLAPVGVSSVSADSFTTTGAEDYFFTLEEAQLFTVRTFAQQYSIDSMLWLYDSNNMLLAENDDWFGLDSYITRNLDAGTYRLRTGVCCGDPNRWYGTSYVVDVSIAPSNAPTTTTTTTTSSTTTTSTTSTTTTTTTTTTVPPTTTTTLPPLGMRSPTNLQAVAGYESVSLTWDAPEGGPGYAEVERYAVFFSSNNWQSSFAIASNTTSATVGNLDNGVTYQFRVRADNDTLSVYSSMTETYTVSAVPQTTSTTSSTSTSTTSTTIPQSTTTSSVPQTTLPESTTTTTLLPEQSTSTTSSTTSTTSTTVPETSTTLVENTTSTTTTTSSTTTSVPEVIVEVPTGTTTTVVEEPTPEVTLPEETTTTTEPEPETTEPETTTTETYPDTTVEETTTTTTTTPEEVVAEEEIIAVIEELTDITEITPEVLSEVVDALNSDNITEEQVQAIVDAVVENLDTLTEITAEILDEVLDILESDSITQEQVQEVVDTILATEISSDQATELATSAAVLENVTADQATEIFATIDTGELTGEQAEAIVEAVQDAPTEVREAFEEEINVFEGGFDNYIPTDSTISVGARRVVVAVTTVSFILPAPVVSSRRL